MTWDRFVELWFYFNITNLIFVGAALFGATLWTFVINPLLKHYRKR
jgi:hypothetical protein